MLKFNMSESSADTVRAVEELAAEFGFAVDNDGIAVKTVSAERGLTVDFDGKELTIAVGKRVQTFAALKLFIDSYDGKACAKSQINHFTDLTYMLDCSRNSVPKVQTVKKLVRHLAFMGYDSLQLYTEDTFVVEKQPYFGYLRNPYTESDIREIDDYCRLFGIELVPCIQTLAHFNTLTRDYALDYLFDVNDILLVGEDTTYAFIEDLIATVAKCFTSRRINIGMDEAYMLGRGRYMDRNGARPRFDIMAEHLDRVNGICQKYGMQPMMWSDMFFSLTMSAQYGADGAIAESAAAKVPNNIELIYWDYCSTDRQHYDDMLKKHGVFENEVAFAGGAWKWLGYAPDNFYSLISGEAQARASIDNHVKHFIVTGWGDNGGECSVFATLPAMLYYSRLNYGKFARDAEFANSFEKLTGMPLDAAMCLDLPNRITDHNDVEEKNSANKYLLFNDVLLGTLDTIIEDGVGKRFVAHEKALLQAEKSAGKWSYLFATMRELCGVLAVKADMGLKLRDAYQASDRAALKKHCAALKTLPQKIESLYEALRRQWDYENRPNGFDVQDIRFGALKQRISVAIRKMDDYLNGRTDAVSELDEKLLCFMGHGENFEKDFDQCEWRWRRMTSVNVNE